jgi:predicted alpha/beta superfamily hydrolase
LGILESEGDNDSETGGREDEGGTGQGGRILENWQEDLRPQISTAMGGGDEYLRLIEEDIQVEPQYSIRRALIRCI